MVTVFYSDYVSPCPAAYVSTIDHGCDFFILDVGLLLMSRYGLALGTYCALVLFDFALTIFDCVVHRLYCTLI